MGHEHKNMGHETANWGGRGLGYMLFNTHLCNQPCYCQVVVEPGTQFCTLLEVWVLGVGMSTLDAQTVVRSVDDTLCTCFNSVGTFFVSPHLWKLLLSHGRKGYICYNQQKLTTYCTFGVLINLCVCLCVYACVVCVCYVRKSSSFYSWYPSYD